MILKNKFIFNKLIWKTLKFYKQNKVLWDGLYDNLKLELEEKKNLNLLFEMIKSLLKSLYQ